jgi:hypothetical protein
MGVQRGLFRWGKSINYLFEERRIKIYESKKDVPTTVVARSKARNVLTFRTLGSWVRITLEVWNFVCVYSVFVLSSV